MDLFLIRHGVAVPRSPKVDDAARPLTARGERRLAQAVRGLATMGIGFDRVLYSPWRRAAETAELLAPLVAGTSGACGFLAEPPSPALLAQLEGERVALVGHEPWMTELLAWLVAGSRSAGPHYVLKKGGVAWLTGEPREKGMRLYALLPPSVLRGVARGRPS